MDTSSSNAPVTPEEIITLILAEMNAGLAPSFYSNLVPSVFHVYLYAEDLERLRPVEQRIRDEAARALSEELARLNKAGVPLIRVPLFTEQKKLKRYEALEEWSIEIHENTDEDARNNPLVIHSSFPMLELSDDRAGTLTERVTRRRPDGQTSTTTTTTTRGTNLDTKRAAGIVYATLDFEDDTGAHTFQMTKDIIKIGRGAADRWVDLKLSARKDVSREHVQLRRDASTGKFFIKDLSTLGTTVNGKRIPKSIEQVDGADVDKNVEAALPEKANIGLAGVVTLNFKAAKSR